MLEDRQKKYSGYHQVGKRIYTIFVRVGHQRSASLGLFMDREGRA